jgi:hypothetical protein
MKIAASRFGDAKKVNVPESYVQKLANRIKEFTRPG